MGLDADGFADVLHSGDDVIRVKDGFHDFDLFLVDGGVKLALDLFFQDMEDREAERDARQRAHPGGIALRHGARIDLCALRCGRAEENDHVIGAVRIDRCLDSFLTFKVKCSGGGSNKALRLHHHRLSAGTAHAGLDRRAGHTVPLSDDNHSLSRKIHVTFSLYRAAGSSPLVHIIRQLREVYPVPGFASMMNDSPSDIWVMRPRKRLPFARNIEYW